MTEEQDDEERGELKPKEQLTIETKDKEKMEQVDIYGDFHGVVLMS